MVELLSPENVLARIDSGEDPLSAFARLDIDQCRFVPTVEATCPPDVQVNARGFGPARNGYLAVSLDDRNKLSAQELWPISFVENAPRFDVQFLGRSRARDFIVSFVSGGKDAYANSHSQYNLRYYSTAKGSSIWLDDHRTRNFSLCQTEPGLVMQDGRFIKSGTPLTIDPEMGRLWFSHVPVVEPSAAFTAAVVSAFAKLKPQHKPLAFSLRSGLGDLVAALVLQDEYHLGRSTVLDIPDVGLRSKLEGCGLSAAFSKLNDAGSGNIWEHGIFEEANEKNSRRSRVRNIYRLVDIHSLNLFLPVAMQRAVAAGEDHLPGTDVFRWREWLYASQLRSIFAPLDCASSQHEFTTIIPSVTTGGEVGCIRRIWSSATQEFPHGGNRFGVMAETAASLDNMQEIAPQCHDICFGLGDLSASVLNVERNPWVTVDGIPVFRQLHPRVEERMAEAVKMAREANPDIYLTVTGDQVNGHHPPSTEACLRMGFNAIAIPPSRDSLLRSMAVCVRYAARCLV